MGMDSFADISPGFDPGAGVPQGREPRCAGARTAAHEDLRFIGVALPRVLGRAPWEDDGTPGRPLPLPPAHAPGPAERVWTSPVYAFAAAADAGLRPNYSWPAEVRGADLSEVARGGVHRPNLPFERFPSDLAQRTTAARRRWRWPSPTRRKTRSATPA